MTDPFHQRVPEANVADVLRAIAAPPGLRREPQAGDMPGAFDFWFDSGACRHHTGSAHYDFADGTKAVVAYPAAWLWVEIQFADGQSVQVVQKRKSPTPGSESAGR